MVNSGFHVQMASVMTRVGELTREVELHKCRDSIHCRRPKVQLDARTFRVGCSLVLMVIKWTKGMAIKSQVRHRVLPERKRSLD